MAELIAFLVPTMFVVAIVATACVVVYQRMTGKAATSSVTAPDSTNYSEMTGEDRILFETYLFTACAHAIQAGSSYLDRNKVELLLELCDAQEGTNHLQYSSNANHAHSRARHPAKFSGVGPFSAVAHEA